MSLTPEDIKDLRAAEAKMAPGPWKPYTRTIIAGDGWTGWALIPDAEAGDERIVCEGEPNDTDGIVALRNAAPALLTAADELAALRLEHESWGALIDGLRASLATVTRERDEARADMADVQARYGRAWEALCHIGETIEAAGYPQLLPERALRVGEGVAKIINERDELRAALQSLRDVAHMALSGDASGPDVEHQIACADAALAGGKS